MAAQVHDICSAAYRSETKKDYLVALRDPTCESKHGAGARVAVARRRGGDNLGGGHKPEPGEKNKKLGAEALESVVCRGARDLPAVAAALRRPGRPPPGHGALYLLAAVSGAVPRPRDPADRRRRSSGGPAGACSARVRPRGGGGRPRRGRRGRRARSVPRATLLDEPRYALVTGCEAPLGAAAAEALAARGYGVVVVAARDGAARAVARRLRQNHGAVCVPVAAPGLGRNAAAAVRLLDEQLARANVTARLDVFVHAPPAAPATASAGTGEGAPPLAADAAERLPDGLPGEDGAALEARCGTAAQLARRFGGAMAARRRGRCGFVVGGDGDASEEADDLASADAFTETFAARLRRRLAPDGVGVTVVRRAPHPPLLARGRFGRRVVDNRVAPEQADGERLVAAVLRGDAHVSLSPGLF